jgi:hypothetical protein
MRRQTLSIATSCLVREHRAPQADIVAQPWEEYMTIATYAGAAPASLRARPRLSGFGLFRLDLDGTAVLLPPITRIMLARLVLARGALVYADDLYRDSWPDPVATVRREQRVAVHKRIAELRRCLCPEGGTDLLLTERSARTGYRLLLDDDQVDLRVFTDLVFRSAAVRDAVAVDLLVQALAMWTERPLLGLPDRAFVWDQVAWLTKLRDRACRDLAAGCRALGREREARTAFDRLQARHPGDTGLRALIDQ